ncbi:UNVERIFIED_CONTAM: hypothetical protein K2H54_048755 [Gekko kuhli]
MEVLDGCPFLPSFFSEGSSSCCLPSPEGEQGAPGACPAEDVEQHIRAPCSSPHQAGQCLHWVCKACKKQSNSGDGCQVTMLWKRCHLQKVNQAFKTLKRCTATSPGQRLPKVEILHSAIHHIEGLQHLLRCHCCHPPAPSSSEPTSPSSSCSDGSGTAVAGGAFPPPARVFLSPTGHAGVGEEEGRRVLLNLEPLLCKITPPPL